MLIWQQFTCAQATRRDGTVDIAITRQNTRREDHLSLCLDIRTYRVLEAWIETPRSACVPVTRQSMDCLIGQELYLGRARDIVAALSTWQSEGFRPQDRHWLSSMALDALTVAFQAEAFLWKQRGHSKAEDYVQHFLSLYGSGCVLYSDPDFRLRDYAEYTQGQLREHTLFSRHRSVHLSRGDRICARAFLCDSFHEIGLELVLDPETRAVLEVDGRFVRAPEDACRRAEAQLPLLVGSRLVPEHRKDMAAILGGEQGCAHISDLVADVARTVADARHYWSTGA